MITSNAGAEFSTKTTIIVALAANHRKMRGSDGSPALLRGRRAFPDKTQLITQRKYEASSAPRLHDLQNAVKDGTLLLKSPH